MALGSPSARSSRQSRPLQADYRRTFATALAAIDRNVALARAAPVRAFVDENLSAGRFSVLALLGLALVALVPATIGVYRAVAYSVEQRRREIGLRLALGATSIDDARSFVEPAIVLATAGVAIGVAGTL